MKFKPNAPSCFISYCHKNADFVAIEKFEEQLRFVLGKDSTILRDKENSKVGDSIREHESAIWSVDAVIILFTPEYLTKIRNREDGVNREYSMIMARHLEAKRRLRTGESKVSEFRLIPIFFAGLVRDAVPQEIIDDDIFIDFSMFKTHTNHHGEIILPDGIKKNHASKFLEISAKITQVSNEQHDNYLLQLAKIKRSLFIDTKYEVLQRKLQNKDLSDVLNQIFVQTRSYIDVKNSDSVILTGRKGSGKSTTASRKADTSEDHYNTVSKVFVDGWNFEFMYAMIASPAIGSDIDLLFYRPRFFAVVWKCFIYFQMGKILIMEKSSLDETGRRELNNKITPLVSSILNTTDLNDELFGKTEIEFVWIFRKALESISEIIEEARNSEAEFGADIISQTQDKKFIQRILSNEFYDALLQLSSHTKSTYLIFDGFDMKFDDFRNSQEARYKSSKEKKRRVDFQISWLRGLFQAFIEVSADTNGIDRKIDMCIGVPKDRYFEIQQLERDGYRYSSVVTELRWSAIELMIMLRKRLEVYQNEYSNSLNQREKFNELMSKLLGIDTYNMVFGENYVEVDLFIYILRHTFWRPRDIISLASDIISNSIILSERGRDMDENLIRETISKGTYSIINDEFFGEYRTICTNLDEIINKFIQSENILSFKEISNKIGRIHFEYASGIEELITEKLSFLYELGFLGVYSQEDNLQQGKWPHKFYFSHGGEALKDVIRLNNYEKTKYIIHPIFSEYLKLKVDPSNRVNFYSMDFLEQNDLIQ